MGVIFLEIVLIAVLILLNGIFSMSELAIVSSRRVRLERAAQRGSRGAQAALELARDPRRFLSTVQIGITLVGVLAGAFGGATIVRILGEWINAVPLFYPYGEAIAFVVVVALITYFSILVGELIPKSLALNSPERIAAALSRPMKFVSKIAAPVVWLLSVPTSMVLKALGVHAKVDPPVTDEEIRDLIDAGTKAGVFEESEQEMIESVIELESQSVTSLMTPRTKIEWIDIEAPPEAIRATLASTGFSRLPAGRGSLDNIVGYVTARAALRQLLSTDGFDVERLLQNPIYIPETLTVLELLEQFRDSRTHVAIAVDEHGGVEGLLTMHNLMEAIVGELAGGFHSKDDPKVHKLADGSLVLDGSLPIIRFADAIGIDEIPQGDRGRYRTVAGFVLSKLGRLPKVGESFEWLEFKLTIAEMDKNRVRKIVVQPRRATPDR